MKDYDAYLFDWDGTLADSHPMWYELFQGQLKRYGIESDEMEIAKKLFGRYEAGIREYDVPEEDVPALIEEVKAIAPKRYPLVDMFPDAKKVLETLKSQGKKLALISASRREIIDIAITRHELLDLFDVTICGDEMKAQKPDPGGLLTALRKFGVQPERAIMVGDSPKDLLAAKNAGTDSLLFYPPEHEMQHSKEESDLCDPTYTVRSWRELLDQLQ